MCGLGYHGLTGNPALHMHAAVGRCHTGVDETDVACIHACMQFEKPCLGEGD